MNVLYKNPLVKGQKAGVRVGLGAAWGKNELVSNTASFLSRQRWGWCGGPGVGKGNNELVSNTTSFVPLGRVGKSKQHGHFGSRYTLRLHKNAIKNVSRP